MIWARQARFVGAQPNDWIQDVAKTPLAAISGLEDVVRIANFVWSEND